VIFQGYLSFARFNTYWNIQSTSWGFTIAPWIFISAFLLLVLGWIIRTRVKEGIWTWQSQALERVDLVTGVAPKVMPLEPSPKLWKRISKKILDAI
jgi:hypothetical protein